ncbi:MAG TPA: succinate--CoA ligase subunit beta, partial [Thermoprotei archaeon]|nr:succinate--CoA ligase subunit beta [Thermoprotei archaeon]
KIYIDPLIGLSDYQVRKAINFLDLSNTLKKDIKDVILKMYNIFIKYDCELVEINPLAISSKNNVYALDAKIIIDENSLYRHKDLMKLTNYISRGYSYVELDGDIGIMGNGAGLTMATMDMVKYFGGRPANFLDIGGGASADRVKEALKILLRNNKIKVILVNILGGITRCDEVAKGIIKAIEETGINKPFVVRLMGTNEEEGMKILSEKGIPMIKDIEKAVKKAIEIRENI